MVGNPYGPLLPAGTSCDRLARGPARAGGRGRFRHRPGRPRRLSRGGRPRGRARARRGQVRRARGSCRTSRSSRGRHHPRRPTTKPSPRPSTRSAASTSLVSCVGIFDFYRGLGDIDAGRPRRRVRRDVRVNVKSHLHAVKAAAARAARAAGARSCSPSRPRRTTRAAAACSTWPRSSPSAGWSPPWPTSWHRRSGSTASPRAAPCTPTCAEPRSLGLDDQRLDDGPDRAAELAARVPLQVALPARTTRGATSSSPRSGPGASPATWCTPTAGWGPGDE